jgi:hypothetical protein
MERYVSPMPRRGIFRNAVLSRYVAITQPSPKIVLNFAALYVPADGAVPRHAINLPGGLKGRELFFHQTTNKTSGNNPLR